MLWFIRVAQAVGLLRVAHADQPGGAGTPPIFTLTNPLSCNDFNQCVDKLTGNLLTISIPIAAIMILVGGFQIMTAGGNEENLTRGRKTLTYAAIGFAVVVLAKSVVTILQSIFS